MRVKAEVEAVRDVKVEIVRSYGGIFEVTADGRALFSKSRQRRFPQPGEVLRLLGWR